MRNLLMLAEDGDGVTVGNTNHCGGERGRLRTRCKCGEEKELGVSTPHGFPRCNICRIPSGLLGNLTLLPC
jgi:hypothetical protein